GTLKNAYTGNMLYEYSFNDEGMLESKSASGKKLLSYDYDKNNNTKTIKDITGKSSIYSYDDANRVKEIKDNNEDNLVNYAYFKNDNIKSINYGNGLKSNYSYDGDGNVESLVTVTSTGEVLVDYNYAYDLNGNRIEKVSSKHKNHYTYDSMNRLKDSSYDGRQESFTYDKAGNRLSKTTNDITDKYVYNVKNQLKELQQNSGTNHFTYDKQGNTIKEETQVGNNSYEYNNLNQQVKAITKEGNTLVSRYDTEGLRAEIEENEKLTKFIFHKENVLVETDEEYNPVSRFTRGYEVVAADINDNTEENRYYYTHDEQGSTVFITNNEQEIRNEYCYDAFGNVLESTEDVQNRITYTGQQFDGITNQYYLRARFYNPVIGRFTQEDVYRGDGLNLYGYCGSNPVGYCDPSGYEGVVPLNDTKEAYRNRVKYTPKKDAIYGKWTGERGESKFNLYQYEDMSEQHKNAGNILEKYNKTGVDYKNGISDFDEFTIFQVDIDMSTDRPTNYARTSDKIAESILNGDTSKIIGSNVKSQELANTILGDKKINKIMNNSKLTYDEKSNRISSRLNTVRKTNQLTVHELNNGKRTQWIPTDINGTFGHLGGVSELKLQEQSVIKNNKCG
ncbi:RHS repeat domain-containing protein, partial [Clostridium estertheticum]